MEDTAETDFDPRNRAESVMFDTYNTNVFEAIIENISKGNYGKITDDDLLGDSADFNESLGVLSNLEDMKVTLQNLKKKVSKFVIELDGMEP